jgi:hypothetical protein
MSRLPIGCWHRDLLWSFVLSYGGDEPACALGEERSRFSESKRCGELSLQPSRVTGVIPWRSALFGGPCQPSSEGEL